MLNGKWSLGDVDDVEGLVRSVLLAELAKRDVRLPGEEFEDLLARMLESAWKESERFDPARGLKLETWLRQQLKLRYIDATRVMLGRTRWQWKDGKTFEKDARPRALSLDAADQVGGRTLAETIADQSSDPAASHDSDGFRELLADRDLEAPWDQALVRAAARRLCGDGAVQDRRHAA